MITEMWASLVWYVLSLLLLIMLTQTFLIRNHKRNKLAKALSAGVVEVTVAECGMKTDFTVTLGAIH